MNKNWKNNQITGLIIGFIVPLIASWLIYQFRYTGAGTYIEFLSKLNEWDSLGKLLSLSVIPNLLFFFIGLKMEWMKSARGVLTATMIYGVVALIIFMAQ
ncbi:hypothetical protein [Natronoflexus pectinivorans]|uniref:Uncharacterized protein n=1 Tax=Natronoflexus pectinivorans TaxID=682526 RepID=A0A4R2GGC3_9BACT|nr:hypothetical protein [Natronoflexus pectinivorans]TCO07323.1 hypothetical protein EV194_109142 [Natronoflexus pectinivorans]